MMIITINNSIIVKPLSPTSGRAGDAWMTGGACRYASSNGQLTGFSWLNVGQSMIVIVCVRKITWVIRE